MSSSHYGFHDQNQQDEASKNKVIQTNVNIRRPHNQYRQGGSNTACLAKEMRKMTVNIRNIAQQNANMQYLLMQIQVQAGSNASTAGFLT